MAVTGTHLDRYSDMFTSMLTHELAKSGSRLSGLVTIENVHGNKVYFDKLGKKEAYIKTQRNQDRTFAESAFERRLFTRQLVSYDEIMDVDDMTRFVSDPTSDIAKAAVEAVGRQIDEIIFAGITGTANVLIDGSASTKSITNTIAVNDHDYDSAAGTNDIGLTAFKLRKAKKLLMENYVDVNREPLFVLAPASQLAILSTNAELVSKDYRNSAPLDLPGLDQALSGFLGFNFIAYEDTGFTNTTDENVYVFTKSAIKAGIAKPLTTKFVEMTSKVGIPMSISVVQDMGAVRMHDEAVIKIVCDPTVAKSA